MNKTALSLLIALFVYILSGHQSINAQEPVPSLLFHPTQITSAHNQTFTVDIVIDTAGQQAAGVGAEIFYDKNNLEITDIQTYPVFDSYPTAAYDNNQGIATISGINEPGDDDKYQGNDTIATITFTAKASGQSTVKFNFLPNNTRDSNIAVTTGTGDILEFTNTLDVSITGGSQPVMPQEIQTSTVTSQPSKYLLYILIAAALILVIISLVIFLTIRKKQQPSSLNNGPTIIIPNSPQPVPPLTNTPPAPPASL